MFTGLIQEIGTVSTIRASASGTTLTIEAPKTVSKSGIGDSIAVNGVCSTVTHLTETGFTADYMPESLNKTTIGQLKEGDAVNLETCLTLQDKLGGHMVSGHVDTVGTLLSTTIEDGWHTMTIKFPETFAALAIMKGSITIDGISLTISGLTQNSLSVSLIPHTLEQTTLQYRKENDPVNLEFDLMGKYILRMQEVSQTKEAS